jgi:D-tagatose-1,6-bisphosphate aldolase subunit GatZ/KbaZ
LRPTPVEEVERTIDITKKAFYSRGLQSAWKRVIAVVVQPGVEFGDSAIIDYDREKAKPLSDFIAEKENLVFEAHSTDYQNQQSLRKMVEDHFVILKVGPALTFAFREAVFALAQIEKELNNSDKKIRPSRLIETLEDAMLKNPKYWQKHYRGNEREQVFARKYSFSDRIRYYWPDTNVKSALNQLFKNLSLHPAPISLLSFFMPVQYNKIREGLLQNNSLELVRDKIMEVTKAYAVASGLVN